ncbi:hypothetical protein F7725_004161 [Dissostichus mawsoni]|uniref:Uncharacterized protein n=1 Tax=Dissostichus mawsoni TaxID=36200 RepID=A0A7J5XHX0_DISMA|nr:hypothetical protein F7725_004161 [Dissostichus mawsoni]
MAMLLHLKYIIMKNACFPEHMIQRLRKPLGSSSGRDINRSNTIALSGGPNNLRLDHVMQWGAPKNNRNTCTNMDSQEDIRHQSEDFGLTHSGEGTALAGAVDDTQVVVDPLKVHQALHAHHPGSVLGGKFASATKLGVELPHGGGGGGSPGGWCRTGGWSSAGGRHGELASEGRCILQACPVLWGRAMRVHSSMGFLSFSSCIFFFSSKVAKEITWLFRSSTIEFTVNVFVDVVGLAEFLQGFQELLLLGPLPETGHFPWSRWWTRVPFVAFTRRRLHLK